MTAAAPDYIRGAARTVRNFTIALAKTPLESAAVVSKPHLVAVACLLLACESTQTSSSGGGARVFYPERGVACDRATQVCYIDSRPSASQTRAYFGDQAARRIQTDATDSRREPKWIFEPDGETSCDMRTQVCYGPKGPNLNKTRRHFGDAAAARLEQNLGSPANGSSGITRRKHGVGCDQSVRICYDENGPNVKQTRKFFGDAAAKQLEKQLRR